MTRDSRRVHRDDYRPPPFLVETVDLAFDLAARETVVRARLKLRRNPDATDCAADLHLDGEKLELRAVALDGAPLPAAGYRLDDTGLTLRSAPDRCTLDTEVAIEPADNSALLGLYQAGELLCTQCEPEAFRRITYFPDRPDVLARYRVTLRANAERYPLLLANGNPISRRTLPDGRHEVVWDDPHPKPAYLFAIVAGHLATVERRFRTVGGCDVAVRLHVAPEDAGRCDHALDTILRAMAWDEVRYGREYDLDVFNAVAVSAYTMGAMENKGLNIFNDRYALADADTATDRDHRDIQAMVAHEYLHNWSGNRVTCRDWFQLALKEGFTVLREQQFVADQGWAAVRRIEDTRLMRTRQFAEDAGPLAHAVRPDYYEDIENFYTDTVYSKGAEIWRMLRTLVGETQFRQAADRYFDRHDGRAARIEDLVDCVAAASDRDLDAFMGWFERPGTPTLQVSGRYDSHSASYELRLRQRPPESRPDDTPLPIPLTLGLLAPDGQAMPLRLGDRDASTATSRTFGINAREHRIVFTGIHERPVPALLRGFSAPVILDWEPGDDDLRLLAIHERDPVVRWDALQRLALRCLAAGLHGHPERGPRTQLLAAFQAALEQEDGEPGLAAELLTLPGENAIADGLAATDPEAVHTARDGLAGEVAAALEASLASTYRRCRDAARREPYTASPEQISRRALQNVCLGYLARLDDGTELCLAQYRDAGNLTDRIAALALLADGDHPQREPMLEDFRRRYADHPLVLDKWLALQARSPREDTLVRIAALMADPVFSLSQPNRVRALLETLATDNPVRFHAIDGGGYRLLADVILALDPCNPSLAAGLLRHLTGSHRIEPRRAARMRTELERIFGVATLSRGSREITAAALAQSAHWRSNNAPPDGIAGPETGMLDR